MSDRSEFQVAGRGENGNAAKGVQIKKVFIAGDDQIGVAIQGDFKELVVFGIPAAFHNKL